MVNKWMGASCIAIAAMVTVPQEGPASDGPDRMGRIEELASAGLGELAPAEVDLARTLATDAAGGSSKAARLADLQIALLEAMLEAHALEAEATGLEVEALEVEKQVEVQKAAYEFLIEQILSSGVAAYWSGP